MNSLHVAWQQPETKEWIPVATLYKTDTGYQLHFCKGAKRANGFLGFGRMTHFDQVYESPELFPFFANRLISKSRPEYNDYLKWMDLDGASVTALEVLSVTGGIRATDSIELVPDLKINDNTLVLDFFPRALSHLPDYVQTVVAGLTVGAPLFLMHDLQNDFDSQALALRTGNPSTLIGYFAKYYVKSLLRKLKLSPGSVSIKVKKVNLDAPLNMRVLCTLTVEGVEGFSLTSQEDDFHPVARPLIYQPA